MWLGKVYNYQIYYNLGPSSHNHYILAVRDQYRLGLLFLKACSWHHNVKLNNWGLWMAKLGIQCKSCKNHYILVDTNLAGTSDNWKGKERDIYPAAFTIFHRLLYFLYHFLSILIKKILMLLFSMIIVMFIMTICLVQQNLTKFNLVK